MQGKGFEPSYPLRDTAFELSRSFNGSLSRQRRINSP